MLYNLKNLSLYKSENIYENKIVLNYKLPEDCPYFV